MWNGCKRRCMYIYIIELKEDIFDKSKNNNAVSSKFFSEVYEFTSV